MARTAPESAISREHVYAIKYGTKVPGIVVHTTTRMWSPAVWGHLEPSFELRVRPGVALRLYAGVGRVLNRESDACRSTLMNGCPSNIGEQKICGGLALGKAWRTHLS
jgi:hypothetical protein